MSLQSNVRVALSASRGGVCVFDLHLCTLTRLPYDMESASETAALQALIDMDDEIDSDTLDDLEEEAEREMMEELQRENEEEAHDNNAIAEPASSPVSASSSDEEEASSTDMVSYEFGPLSKEHVNEVLSDLRKYGLMECLRRHIVPAPSMVCRSSMDSP